VPTTPVKCMYTHCKKMHIYIYLHKYVYLRRVYFGEKYCTLINAVTQSCLTDNSITIYEPESESGVISDPDKIPHC